jgi:hypothetical protein
MTRPLLGGSCAVSRKKRYTTPATRIALFALAAAEASSGAERGAIAAGAAADEFRMNTVSPPATFHAQALGFGKREFARDHA